MSGAETVLQPFSCPRGPLKGAALWGVPVLPTCRQLRARECRRRPQCRRILSWVCIHRLTLSHGVSLFLQKTEVSLIMVLGCNSELFYFPFPSKKGNYNSPSRIFSSRVRVGFARCVRMFSDSKSLPAAPATPLLCTGPPQLRPRQLWALLSCGPRASCLTHRLLSRGTGHTLVPREGPSG